MACVSALVLLRKNFVEQQINQHVGSCCLDAATSKWQPANMKRPTRVTALPGKRIEVAYPDGVVGIIDLSDSVGKGIFAPLQDEAFFKTVHIGSFGQIAWSEDI